VKTFIYSAKHESRKEFLNVLVPKSSITIKVFVKEKSILSNIIAIIIVTIAKILNK